MVTANRKWRVFKGGSGIWIVVMPDGCAWSRRQTWESAILSLKSGLRWWAERPCA